MAGIRQRCTVELLVRDLSKPCRVIPLNRLGVPLFILIAVLAAVLVASFGSGRGADWAAAVAAPWSSPEALLRYAVLCVLGGIAVVLWSNAHP